MERLKLIFTLMLIMQSGCSLGQFVKGGDFPVELNDSSKLLILNMESEFDHSKYERPYNNLFPGTVTVIPYTSYNQTKYPPSEYRYTIRVNKVGSTGKTYDHTFDGHTQTRSGTIFTFKITLTDRLKNKKYSQLVSFTSSNGPYMLVRRYIKKWRSHVFKEKHRQR